MFPRTAPNCEQASSGLPPRNHTLAAVFSARWFHVWLQMLSPNVPSQALWLEPKQRTRINCTMQIYKSMQLSKLRGCQTYLPNYAVAVQRKLHLQHTYIHTYIHTDRQTDRHTYIHTDRQTYIHTYIYTVYHPSYLTFIYHPSYHTLYITISPDTSGPLRLSSLVLWRLFLQGHSGCSNPVLDYRRA